MNSVNDSSFGVRPALLGALALVMAACGQPAATPSPTASPTAGAVASASAVVSPSAVAPASAVVSSSSGASSSAPSGGSTVPLTVALGYIPSVQFAPFYLAQQDGAYAAAGLDVTFQNKIDPDLITLVGQGAIDIGIGDGTSVMPAASQSIPIRYVATVYAQFPNAVVARADSGITAPADLKGKTLGTPGKYGSSWIMVQAMLASAGLSPADVDIRLYPDFGQAAALAQGAVASITGFINNEPVQLAAQGVKTSLLRVDAITPLPGPGLVAGVATLAAKHAALAAFVAVTLKAMEDVAADPQKGLDATFAAAPDLASDPAGQLAVLQATIPLWTSPYVTAHGMGAIDSGAWQTSLTFMAGLADSGVSDNLNLGQLIDSTLLPTR